MLRATEKSIAALKDERDHIWRLASRYVGAAVLWFRKRGVCCRSTRTRPTSPSGGLVRRDRLFHERGRPQAGGRARRQAVALWAPAPPQAIAIFWCMKSQMKSQDTVHRVVDVFDTAEEWGLLLLQGGATEDECGKAQAHSRHSSSRKLALRGGCGAQEVRALRRWRQRQTEGGHQADEVHHTGRTARSSAGPSFAAHVVACSAHHEHIRGRYRHGSSRGQGPFLQGKTWVRHERGCRQAPEWGATHRQGDSGRAASRLVADFLVNSDLASVQRHAMQRI